MSQTYEDRPTLEQWNELVATVGSMPKVASGTYTGTAEAGGTGSQHISVGFRPKAVLISTNADGGFEQRGILIDESGYSNFDKPLATVSNDGFTVYEQVYYGSALSPELNRSGYKYYYLAVG